METWYVMEDGSVAHPAEVAPDESGKLRHKDGRAVAYAPHGPRSRSVDPSGEKSDEGRKADPAEPEGKTAEKDLRPARHRRGYVTREQKAE